MKITTHTDLKSHILSTVPKKLIVEYRKTFFPVRSPNYVTCLSAFNFMINALIMAQHQLL